MCAEPECSDLLDTYYGQDLPYCRSAFGPGEDLRFGVGTHHVGEIDDCPGEGWLTWYLGDNSSDDVGIVGRLAGPPTAYSATVDWFRANRPIGEPPGLLWGMEPDGPLGRVDFRAVWDLAVSVPYRSMRRTPERYLGQLVRFTGRVEWTDEDYSRVEVTRTASGSWKDPMYYGGEVRGVIDFVGWAQGLADDRLPVVNGLMSRQRK
jgi:hypothetical protein